MDRQASVLIVDDEPRTTETLGILLERQGFYVTCRHSPGAATQALVQTPFDAVVTDVVFEGHEAGPEILAAARGLQPNAIVVLMTGYPALDRAVRAIRFGAVDYLEKPVDPVVLSARIRRALRERELCTRPEQLGFDELVDILSAMVANTIERIDPYTAGHGERTRAYCDLVAGDLGLDRPARERLQLAAVAHDYGKIYLADLGFLTKAGPLTASEYRQVQEHPTLGAEKLGGHPRLIEVCKTIREHHERWDGKGYPDQKRGEEVSISGRILGVVEVFDSLATKRSYKKPWELSKVLDYFEMQGGKAFDPVVLHAFLRQLEKHGEQWIAQPQVDRASCELPRPGASDRIASPSAGAHDPLHASLTKRIAQLW